MSLSRPLRGAVAAALVTALALAGPAGAHPGPAGDAPKAPAKKGKPKGKKTTPKKQKDRKPGKGGKRKGKAKTQQVKLKFKGVAGDTPVKCGSEVAGLGTQKTAAKLLDFRFYVSDVRLLTKDGRKVPVKLKRSPFQISKGKDSLALIDLEDGTGDCENGSLDTNPFVRGTVPRGKYTGVSWTVGVPPKPNHSDTVGAASPLDSTGMAWSWQIGRKFTKIEFGDPSEPPTWKARAFLVHLGSTGCEGDPASGEAVKCAASNRPKITLKKFDTKRQDVALDVRNMLANNDITVNGGGAPGCMSFAGDPECAGVFAAFGLRFGTGEDPGSSAAKQSTPSQTVFRAVKK